MLQAIWKERVALPLLLPSLLCLVSSLRTKDEVRAPATPWRVHHHTTPFISAATILQATYPTTLPHLTSSLSPFFTSLLLTPKIPSRKQIPESPNFKSHFPPIHRTLHYTKYSNQNPPTYADVPPRHPARACGAASHYPPCNLNRAQPPSATPARASSNPVIGDSLIQVLSFLIRMRVVRRFGDGVAEELGRGRDECLGM